MSILQKPFPAIHDPRNGWFAALGFGVFVAVFLYFFRPFGLTSSGDDLAWIAPGYGLVTALCMLALQYLSPKIFPSYYREENWTVGKEVLQIMANVAIIAIGNWIFSAFLGFIQPSPESFFLFFGFTLAVGIFPVSIHVLLRQNAWQRKYLRQSDRLNSRLKNQAVTPSVAQSIVQLRDENDKVALEIPASDLIAIESADNYVKVYYVNSQKLTSEMIRSTLAAVESTLPPQFFRTHRSWLINLDLLEKVNGNARGYTIRLRNFTRDVPVARSRITAFDEIIGRD